MRTGPRLGVLPFSLLGTEQGEAYLAQSLAEEITAGLSRFRGLSLVSTSSIAQAVHDGRDDAVLRQGLGLDYLVDGTVQRVLQRLRITVRLVDLRDGNQVVWTRRFDRLMDDLLTLQDEVAAETVAQIDPEVLQAESRRAALVPVQDAGPYEFALRALPGMLRADRAQFMEAGEWLRRSMERQPDNAVAEASYAYWLHFLIEHGWAEDLEATAEAASHHAERAISLDSQNARAFAIAGHVRAALQRRIPEALSLHERALALNPNLGMAWALSGFAHLYAGDAAQAQRRFDHYKQLSPADPFAFQLDAGRSLVALLNRDFEQAANLGRAVSELNPDFAAASIPYLSALGHLGRGPEAAVIRRRLLAHAGGFSLRRFAETSPFSRPEDSELIAAGLRLAGVPESEPAQAK